MHHPPAGPRPVHACSCAASWRTRGSLPASSTAEAVRIVASDRGATAGAGGRRWGRCWRREIYGAHGPARGRARTATTTKRASCGSRGGRTRRRRPRQRERSRLRCGAATGEWKTSLVFWGPGADSPGWLVRCLDEFARRDINLTKIESRPRRERLGSYMFFVDLSGRLERTARSPRRSRACASSASRCACSAPTERRPQAAAERRRIEQTAAAGSRHGDERPRYTPALKMESTVPPEPVGSVPPSEHQRRGPGTSPTTAMGGRVLVLNATYEPINVCTVRRAVVLLLKEKAELLERGRWELHSESSTLARPVVIRLMSYVQRPARRPPPQDHPPRRVRPRQLDLPVLRIALQPDRRPRDPALQGRLLELGEHRRLVRAVQPAQGRPAAAPGGDAPAPRAAHAARGDLHPRRQPHDPDGVAAVPAAGGLIGPCRPLPRVAGGQRALVRARPRDARRAPRRRPSRAALTGKTETATSAAGGTRAGGRLGVSRVGFR